MLAVLWPPYELHATERASRAGVGESDWGRALEESKASLAGVSEQDLADAETLAEKVLEAELRRKDTLESKAATFIVAPSTATAIAAAVAPLSDDLELSVLAIAIAGSAYALALVHLLVASSYAIAVRRVEGFVVLSVANAHSLLQENARERIATRFAFASLNEPALVRKANRLSVSEDLFLRGLAFLAFASVIALLGG